WLNDPLLKDWLQASPDGDGVFCSVRTWGLSCKRYKLYQHAKTSKHIDNHITMKKTLSSAPVASSTCESIDINIRLETSAIKLTSFFAEHNVPISTVDHLVPLRNRIFYDSETASKLVLPRKKCTKILTDVLGKAETINLSDILRVSKFTAMIAKAQQSRIKNCCAC
ncbi:hypothetical protein PV325_012716, partial [Microctonus aethiopoides]